MKFLVAIISRLLSSQCKCSATNDNTLYCTTEMSYQNAERYSIADTGTFSIESCVNPDDLAAAAEFDAAVFTPPRADAFGSKVTQPEQVTAEDYVHMAAHGPVYCIRDPSCDDKIVALCAISMLPDRAAEEPILRSIDTETAYCTVLATDPEYRGRGLGKQLLHHGLEAARRAGKRRMVTTIHPTNVGSQKVFYAEGFLCLGMVDAYYDLPGGSGRRLVMINGGLSDPEWAVSRVHGPPRPLALTEATHSDAARTFDEIAELYGQLLECGHCALGPVEYHDGRISIPVAPFAGNEYQEIARWLYPYDSLSAGYRAARERLQLPDHVSYHLGHIVLSLMDMACFPFIGNPLPVVADATRRMMEWMAKYHQAMQSGTPIMVDLPSAGVLRFHMALREYRRMVLDIENLLLQELTGLPYCDTNVNPLPRGWDELSEIYRLSETHLRILSGINGTLYQHVPAEVPMEDLRKAYGRVTGHPARRLCGLLAVFTWRLAVQKNSLKGLG